MMLGTRGRSALLGVRLEGRGRSVKRGRSAASFPHRAIIHNWYEEFRDREQDYGMHPWAETATK